MGISAIYLTCGLRDNGQGTLIGTELEEAKIRRVREQVAAAGLSDRLEFRAGDALLSSATTSTRRTWSTSETRPTVTFPSPSTKTGEETSSPSTRADPTPVAGGLVQSTPWRSCGAQAQGLQRRLLGAHGIAGRDISWTAVPIIGAQGR
jgi:hypothetical protein